MGFVLVFFVARLSTTVPRALQDGKRTRSVPAIPDYKRRLMELGLSTTGSLYDYRLTVMTRILITWQKRFSQALLRLSSSFCDRFPHRNLSGQEVILWNLLDLILCAWELRL